MAETQQYTAAAIERMMKVQDVLLKAPAFRWRLETLHGWPECFARLLPH